MKKLALPLMLLVSLSSCEVAQRMNDLVVGTTYSIDANTCTVQQSTATVYRNAALVAGSNSAIAENRAHLEQLSEE